MGGRRGPNSPESAVILAHHAVQEIRRVTLQATRGFDVVLSPVAPVAAFPAHWHGPTDDPDTALAHIAYTVPYNFSEQPAATLNAGFTADRRPVGVQLAGRPLRRRRAAADQPLVRERPARPGPAEMAGLTTSLNTALITW